MSSPKETKKPVKQAEPNVKKASRPEGGSAQGGKYEYTGCIFCDAAILLSRLIKGATKR